MHNLNTEYQNEFEMGNEMELSPEFEYAGEYSKEYGNELELSPEFEYENSQLEYTSELSQELMEVSNEAEFGSWLKKALKKGAGLATNFLNSATGQKATSALNDIAQKTLPGYAAKAGAWLGGKVGGLVGQRDYGAQLGMQGASSIAQTAAGKYQDFAKFATDAVGKMAQEYETGTPPAIKPAIVKAAAKHYPIILKVKGTLHARQAGGSAMNKEYEYNNEYSNETSYEGEIGHNEGTFNEVTEMELASELLSVQSEAELDQFLGKLFKKAAGAVGKFAKSGLGKSLGGMLKGIAKKALPIAGGALGTFLLPGVGTAIGGALGGAAGNLFELELEGLSPEDREFEVARAYVRFAGNAARRASRMNNMGGKDAARTAIMHSARRYAPGLLARNRRDYHNQYNQYNYSDQSGSWRRDGDRIIIEGI